MDSGTLPLGLSPSQRPAPASLNSGMVDILPGHGHLEVAPSNGAGRDVLIIIVDVLLQATEAQYLMAMVMQAWLDTPMWQQA